jgi:hypothetical protein
MGVYDFKTDLPNAEKVADVFESLLKKSGYTTVRAPNGYFPDWDIKAIQTVTDKSVTFEIKFDEMSSDTGNIAIEYESRGKKSGISTTKATYWVQFFDNTFHIVSVEALREKMLLLKHRDVVGGDPGSNTKMYLIKKDKFKSICIATI